MRPERDDIAVPELPPGIEWIGGRPATMAALTIAGAVLVHFIDFAQLNSVRTLPYIEQWHERYTGPGLTVLGVQAPRFDFGANPATVEAGLRGLGVNFPVVVDATRELWLDYGCEGWPSLFLWGQGGALRWFHFGEGEYRATEEAIQEELRAIDALREFPRPLDPIRPTEAPGAMVITPTPEIFPAPNRAWNAAEDGPGLSVSYEAAGAYATLEGEGELLLELDGEALAPLQVEGAGLYELADHGEHGTHTVAIGLGGDIGVWSISFSPGLASVSE